MTGVTNPEQTPEGRLWPRGTLRLYPLLCELSWVFNIGDEPPRAAERIDDVPAPDSEPRTALGPLGPEPLSGLEPPVRRLLSRVEVPPEPMGVALRRFVTFRRGVDAPGPAHTGLCLRPLRAPRGAPPRTAPPGGGSKGPGAAAETVVAAR